MKIEVDIRKQHALTFAILVVIFLTVLAVGTQISPGVGYHPLSEIVKTMSDKTIVDSDGNGIIDDSDALGGFASSLYQLRATWSCAPGSSLRQINADGSVVCETDDVGSGGNGSTPQVLGQTLVSYDGLEVGTYANGTFGGYKAGNEKCVLRFGQGARMCSSSDFIYFSFPTGPGNVYGWYNTFASSWTLNGATLYYFSDCKGWSRNEPEYYGGIWFSSNNPGYANCNSQNPIVCCK